MKYTDKHAKIFDGTRETLDSVIRMDDDSQNLFISTYVIPYIVDGTELEWEAEDVIDMIKCWDPGQRED